MGRLTATGLMAVFAGFTLDRGRYRVFEKIGSGAYGRVYRSIETSPRLSKGRIFAIKCLNRPEPGSHADLLQQREFAHHKLVSGHPNIVTFHRCFSDGLFVYVVLDFCDGDLFSAITEKGLFYRNDLLIKTAFVQLIDAVEHCHKFGVFHRDIKPENVLCSNDGTDIQLADFGLSIMSPFSKDFGCGSSYYMSPECIGRHVGRRQYVTSHNDVWALGVVLTNMITGRSPWRYATPDDACFAAYLKDDDFLKKVLPISKGVNSILKNIFSLNPSRRPTLAELRTKILALDFFSTHASISITGNDLLRENVSSVSTRRDILQASSLVKDSDPEGRLLIENHAVHVPVENYAGPNLKCRVLAPSGPLTVPFSASSGSSGTESKGPTTPATHAINVDPVVHIPDISADVLGDPVALGKSPAIHKRSAAVRNIKSRRPGDIFRSAVHHIKNLSKVISIT